MAALTLALALRLPDPAAAARAGDLTIEQAVRSALASYPTVEAARAGTDEARAGLSEAKASRFPSLTLAASGTRHEDPMLVSPLHGFSPAQLPPFDETVGQTTLSLAYPVFDGGARGASVRAADARSRAADAELGAAEQRLIAQVILRYLDILGLRQVVEAHDTRLEALHAERRRVSLLRMAGRAAAVDRLRVEAALANAGAERAQATAQLEVAERALARLSGLPFGKVRAATLSPVGMPEPAEAPRDSLSADARRLSPDVLRAAAQSSASRATLDAARSRRWPQVRLAGSYTGWAHPGGEPSWEWAAALHLSWSVFDGGATRGAIAKAKAGRDGADERLRLAAFEFDQEADRALARLDESGARASSFSAAVERFTEVVRIERLLLESGTGTQTNYLEAVADLLAARSGLIESRHASIAARAELARLKGQLGYGWISRTMEAKP